MLSTLASVVGPFAIQSQFSIHPTEKTGNFTSNLQFAYENSSVLIQNGSDPFQHDYGHSNPFQYERSSISSNPFQHNHDRNSSNPYQHNRGRSNSDPFQYSNGRNNSDTNQQSYGRNGSNQHNHGRNSSNPVQNEQRNSSNPLQYEYGQKSSNSSQNDVNSTKIFAPTESGANDTMAILAKAIGITTINSIDSINSSNSSIPTNATNSTLDIDYPQIPEYIRTTSMVFCIIIMCLGVVGNVMVPIVIMKTKDMRNSTNIFLMNLSIADLMVLLVCTPTVLVEVNTRPETWVLGKEMCK